MTDDPIMKRFADINVPGRRRPVNRDQPVVKPKQVDWDARPVRYRMGGVDKEFFTIRHVAMAFGRSVQSIRAWEDAGVLPKSPYRSPKPRNGTIAKGRRLWTREQIEGMLSLAKQMGLILDQPGGKRGKPPTPVYAMRVHELFVQLVSQQQPQS